MPTLVLGDSSLDSSDLRIHTVHTSDIAASLLLLARYLMTRPCSETLAESSVPLAFPFHPPTSLLSTKSKRTSISESWKTVPTVVPEKEEVKIVLFNVVDENDSTQEKLAKAVAEVWGINFGFMNSTIASLVQQFAKVSRAMTREESEPQSVDGIHRDGRGRQREGELLACVLG